MRRRRTTIETKYLIIIGIFVVLLIGGGLTSYFSRSDKGITEVKIPPETLEYLKRLSAALGDLRFDFFKGKKGDWTGKQDDAEANKYGLQKLENQFFVAYFHDHDESKASLSMEKATEAISRMRQVFGQYPLPTERKLPLYIAKDAEEYANLSGSSITESRACAVIFFYSDGNTFCKGLYFAPSTYQSGEDIASGIVAHELAHYVYFDKVSFSVRYLLPIWFTEGIAEYTAERTEFLPLVKEAILNHRLIPISELSSSENLFKTGALIYGEGCTAFLTIESRFSLLRITQLISNSYTGRTIEASFLKVLGLSLKEFDLIWLAQLNIIFG